MHADLNVITLEEHYGDSELADCIARSGTCLAKDVLLALRDLSEARLRTMDEAGIDMQVLSLADPNPQELPTGEAVNLTRRANDRLAETCAAHSGRFAGFAALPTQVPEEAALELERCIKSLRFTGAMVRPLTNGGLSRS